MLLQTRRIGESIFIGEGIVVKVVDVISEERVRIGVEAPAEIKVQRAEQSEPAPNEKGRPESRRP